jgi:hypothetical protein
MKLIKNNLAVESRNYTAPVVNGFLQNTVQVATDEYGGAHRYVISNLNGRDEDGHWVESESLQELTFFHRIDDKEMVSGVIDIQVLDVLIDRIAKLNGQFPDPSNNLALSHLYAARSCVEQRSKERFENGKLKLVK